MQIAEGMMSVQDGDLVLAFRRWMARPFRRTRSQVRIPLEAVEGLYIVRARVGRRGLLSVATADGRFEEGRAMAFTRRQSARVEAFRREVTPMVGGATADDT